ncbi:MAG: sodium:proton antiporter NhaD [Bacteroidaceae bacterium]|jgi:Na+/H+ antiporter NhaD/arsenite permease-like protein|nr:sodium:proton antiporter NhaD [Bacteroidaceae bacterium]
MCTILIVGIFIVGYLCIVLEHNLKVNKAPIALFMCVACWTCYFLGVDQFITGVADPKAEAHSSLLHHLSEACEILFFLMAAMTIVEIIDANGGFNFVRNKLITSSKRKLLWRVAFITFFLSALLDNLTTSIVMVMVLRKLVTDTKERMIYASLIILAANAGGAFSPIGDVTTIMLWIRNLVSTEGILLSLFIPSIISIVVPTFLLQYSLKGELPKPTSDSENRGEDGFTSKERTAVFVIGLSGLVFVPIFKMLTGLPPYMGALLALSVLWTVTEVFFRRKHNQQTSSKQRVASILSRIDMTTILFFLGILLTVATLQEIGALSSFGVWLNEVALGNQYLITGVIGVASSIVDNVPLVAGCMGMYDPSMGGDFMCDGIFWQLLAYCAGVGGSMLIIGSAAGVVVMGLERISFGWYLRKITGVAFIGYLAGLFAYYVQTLIL